MKFLLHIDMDCFFASVEQILNPRYNNKPLVVSHLANKSIICCANYQARRYGISAAMPLFKARKLCPSLYACPPSYGQYERFNRLFVDLIKTKFTNLVEVCSIDECYVDISHLVNTKQEAVILAYKIQKVIKTKLLLSCTIGVSYNRFLAKMASDYKKPFSVNAIWKEDIAQIIWPQPVDNMLFIGKKTAIVLNEHGIKTIGDIANENNQHILSQLLDKNWYVHYLHATGGGDDFINVNENEPKSIGVEHTFYDSVENNEEIETKLGSLIEEVYGRLVKNKFFTKTITIKVKTNNKAARSRSKTVTLTQDLEIISTIAHDLYQKNFNDIPIRLIGVALSVENNNVKTPIKYHQCQTEVVDELERIIEKINDKLQRNIIKKASDKN